MLMGWDFTNADIELKKAFELEPGNELNWIFYEIFLVAVGRGDEAITLCKRWIKEHEIAQSKQHASYISLSSE